jgi:GTP-binding protein YchF
VGFSCGLVGLPNAGKSTIFAALTGTDTLIAAYPFSTLEPKKGVVPVPDPRLEALAKLLSPSKVTPATLEVVDIAGLVKGASRGEGLGNQFLSHIRAVDALLHVVRCFAATQALHPTGELDPCGDAEIVNTELLLADLEIVERRLENAKKRARADPKAARAELVLLERCHDALARGEAIRNLKLAEADPPLLKAWGLLSAKPLFYAANVDRNDPRSLALARQLEAASGNNPVITVDGKLEGELALLPPDDQATFRDGLGLAESALERLVRVGYQILGLLTFYTVVGEELRAWSLRQGATALDAAGKVHSDMARGFIRAEVIAVEEFLATPSLAELRERGTVRLEGREYRVREGDILTVRFSP